MGEDVVPVTDQLDHRRPVPWPTRSGRRHAGAATIATLNAFVLGKPLGTTGEIVVGLIFTWVTVGAAIIAFRYGKWAPNIGTIVKIAVVAIFTILLIVYLARHGQPAGTSTAADLKPSLNGFLTVIGVLVFLWVGFELSSGASEEMHNPQRDVPKMIVRSGVIAAVLYGLAIGGIILVIPRAGLSSVSGFADAYKAVATDLHSHGLNVVFGILIILTLIGSGSVWLEGADRTQAIAALDGAAPAWMGRWTSFGTPIAVNLASGVVASAFVFFVFLITKGSLANFFSVMLALVISTTAVSYVFVFPALVSLRRKYPDAPRPYRVPGGTAGAWAAVVICELFVIVSAVTCSGRALQRPVRQPTRSRTTGGVPGVLGVGHAWLARGDGPGRRALQRSAGPTGGGADRRWRPSRGRPRMIPHWAVTTAQAAGIQRWPELPYHCLRVRYMRTLGWHYRRTIRERYSRYRRITGAREVTLFGEQEKVDAQGSRRAVAGLDRSHSFRVRGSQFTYVASSDSHAFFKVRWLAQDQRPALARSARRQRPAEPVGVWAADDGSTAPSASHVLGR